MADQSNQKVIIDFDRDYTLSARNIERRVVLRTELAATSNSFCAIVTIPPNATHEGI